MTTKTTTTFRADTTDLTVYATDEYGETSDLNGGEPCENITQLRDFVCELCEQGYYDAETRDDLLGDIADSDEIMVTARVSDDDGYAYVTLRYPDDSVIETGCYLHEAAHMGGSDIGEDQDCWALDSESDRERLTAALASKACRASIDRAIANAS